MSNFDRKVKNNTRWAGMNPYEPEEKNMHYDNRKCRRIMASHARRVNKKGNPKFDVSFADSNWFVKKVISVLNSVSDGRFEKWLKKVIIEARYG